MKDLAVVLAVITWVVGAIASYIYMFAYDSSPAKIAAAAPGWPSGTVERRTPAAFELVIGIHPHCPCTRATVAELNKLVQSLKGRVQAHALVFKPTGFAAAWDRTDITARLEELPHVYVHPDVDGVISRRFGLSTSGQTLLYGPDGRLRFNGGLTSFRGHEGRSIGHSAIEAIVNGSDSAVTASKIFGCGLSENPRPRPASETARADAAERAADGYANGCANGSAQHPRK